MVPTTFTLVQDGATSGHLCQVSWRTDTEVGAHVVSDTDLGTVGLNKSNPLLRKRKQHIVGRYPV